MKYAAIIALAFIGICYVQSEHITDYGNVKGRAINLDYVVAERQMFKIQNKTVTIPRTTWPFIITGIRHVNHKFQPVEAKIVDGGLGQNKVTFNIQSLRGYGINSTFYFYGKF